LDRSGRNGDASFVRLRRRDRSHRHRPRVHAVRWRWSELWGL